MRTIGLAFDIETAKDPYANFPEPKVSLGNLKDPAKIAAKIEETKESLLAKAALDPHLARVVMVATATPHQQPDRCTVNAITIGNPEHYLTATKDNLDRDEAFLINTTWQLILQPVQTDQRFATFNGKSFDLPFLLRRSLILGVPVPQILSPRDDGLSGNHIDVLLALTSTEPGMGRGIAFTPPTPTRRNLDFYTNALCDQALRASLPEIDKTVNHVTITDDTARAMLAEHARIDAHATLILAQLCSRFNPTITD